MKTLSFPKLNIKTNEEKLAYAHKLGVADFEGGYPETSDTYRFPPGELRDAYRAGFLGARKRAALKREG